MCKYSISKNLHAQLNESSVDERWREGLLRRPRGCRGRATVNVTTFVLVLKKAMSGLMYHILIHAPQRLKLCMVHVG